MESLNPDLDPSFSPLALVLQEWEGIQEHQGVSEQCVTEMFASDVGKG